MLSEYHKERECKKAKALENVIVETNVLKNSKEDLDRQRPKKSVLETLTQMRKETPSPESIRLEEIHNLN